MKRMLTGLALVVIAAAAGSVPARAQMPVRLGVYDSRAVAIAYARTPEFAKKIEELRADLAAAVEAKDVAKQKACEQAGEWMQVRMHQRGFSTAGAADLIGDLRSRLPGIAKNAGVVAIVSKWELPYCGDDIELVDLTAEVVGLFHPDQEMLDLMDQLRGQPPVPFDEMGLSPAD